MAHRKAGSAPLRTPVGMSPASTIRFLVQPESSGFTRHLRAVHLTYSLQVEPARSRGFGDIQSPRRPVTMKKSKSTEERIVLQDVLSKKL